MENDVNLIVSIVQKLRFPGVDRVVFEFGTEGYFTCQSVKNRQLCIRRRTQENKSKKQLLDCYQSSAQPQIKKLIELFFCSLLKLLMSDNKPYIAYNMWSKIQILFGLNLTLYILFSFQFCLIKFHLLDYLLFQLFTWLRWAVLLYGIWFYYDFYAPKQGGYNKRLVKWWRTQRIHKYFRDYFPTALHRTEELPTGTVQNFCIS